MAIDGTFFLNHTVAACCVSLNPKRVASVHPVRQTKFEAHAKATLDVIRPSYNLPDTASHSDRVVQRITTGVVYKTQGIKKVALARAIGSNQDVERPEAHVAEGDALIVFDDDARDEW